ncbi:MAG: M2 family metallopeptidase [Planctomycetaceae bacterium]|jgi:peptidyl-dipeptidase A|nr:M2 family metallopeptidase [Planctomycetaceae bacterium]
MQKIGKIVGLSALLVMLTAWVANAQYSFSEGNNPNSLYLITTQTAGQEQFMDFMSEYQSETKKMNTEANLAYWKASISGKEEDFDVAADLGLKIKKYHADKERYEKFLTLRKNAKTLMPIEKRAADIAELQFKSNQLPENLLKKMVNLSTEIEMIFQNDRAELDGKQYTNNELLEKLRQETDSAKREAIWKALKVVGDKVAPKLVELAKIRNQAAKQLGFANFWEMEIVFQEHDPKQIMQIFAELDKLTTPLFTEMKSELDSELTKKFGIKPDEMKPWHYDNPFFQEAPPAVDVDLDIFYVGKTKEDIAEISRKFYQKLGIPADSVLEKSSLYEQPGKSQHGFCTNIDGEGDVRILCNLKPDTQWMDTQLHELGHAVYDVNIDGTLPYNLRQPSHIFTTEGVAMYFGALVQAPQWLIENLGADPEKAKSLAPMLKKQRRREQLIFCRWVLVMLNFEKALYENPEQDLNKLWWDTVEKYQLLHRPENRDAADWAAKPHFTIAPVYYHNYMLGELYSAMIREAAADFSPGSKEYRDLFLNRIFKIGNVYPWQEFVRYSMGKEFSPAAFARELKK